MAVIRCPHCRKRYSSVQGDCPDCGAQPDDAARERKRRRSGVGPNTHYLIAALVAIGGAGWYYSEVAIGNSPDRARFMIGFGIVWYIVARVWAGLRR